VPGGWHGILPDARCICRMTLLLGPPGSGKTTLLLALAGRLDKDLKVCKRKFTLVLVFYSVYIINHVKFAIIKGSCRLTENFRIN
jgi:DNA replication protein DnaC